MYVPSHFPPSYAVSEATRLAVSAGLHLCENEAHLNFCRATGKGGRSGRRNVSHKAETPFDSIEGSHEYVRMLAEAVNEARRDVEEEIAAAEQDRADRRKEALLLVSYNLAKLNLHIISSRRILNDLRSLRRLLLAERGLSVEDESEVGAGD
jgi:hypothetical protein